MYMYIDYINVHSNRINILIKKKNKHLISNGYCYLHNDWFPHKCTHMQTMDFIGKAINLKNNILHVFIHDY